MRSWFSFPHTTSLCPFCLRQREGSPLGSSLTTSRPFRHTTFPVAASTNTSDGMLVTLYLFHSFIYKHTRGEGKKSNGFKSSIFKHTAQHFPRCPQTTRTPRQRAQTIALTVRVSGGDDKREQSHAVLIHSPPPTNIVSLNAIRDKAITLGVSKGKNSVTWILFSSRHF